MGWGGGASDCQEHAAEIWDRVRPLLERFEAKEQMLRISAPTCCMQAESQGCSADLPLRAGPELRWESLEAETPSPPRVPPTPMLAPAPALGGG